MAVKFHHHQVRTEDRIYLFQSKDSKTLSLKVYDIARQRLSKSSIELDASQIKTLFKNPRKENLFPLFPQQKLSSPPALVQDPIKELDQIINTFKLQIPVENKQAEAFTCPITLEAFKDPVIDRCGHTFERAAIEDHLKIKGTCPISRKPIKTEDLIPNRQIRQNLDSLQVQDPIPTFSLFKKDNPTLAKAQLQAAAAFLEAGEYEEAIDAYNKAFQYTQNWEDYQHVPLLFEKMNNLQKAYLANLYLARYQIQARQNTEAINTFSKLCGSGSSFLQPEENFSKVLVYTHFCVYLCMDQERKTPTLALATRSVSMYRTSLLPQKLSQKMVIICKYVIYYEPTQWSVYEVLADLIEDSQEKSHYLLQGACRAIEYGEVEKAQHFCNCAEALFPNSFTDRKICLQLVSPDTSLFLQKLTALAKQYETQNNTSQALKVYRLLTPLNRDSSYIVKQLKATVQPQRAHYLALHWLKEFLQQEDYTSASAVAEQTLQLLSNHSLSDPIPLYEQLAHLYTHQSSPKLEQIFEKLIKTHQAQGNFALAEQLSQEAFQKFPTLQTALALAQAIHQQPRKHAEAAQAYYLAASLALEQGNFQQLELIISTLLQAPLSQYLDINQKVHLLTQRSLFQMSKDLQETKTELNLLKQKRHATSGSESLLSSIAPAHKKQKRHATSSSRSLLSIAPARKASSAVPKGAFGKAKWATHFGDVGEEPPLPADIHQVLQGPCPIWPGKTVEETHILTLIPATVDGAPLTIKTLGKLIQNPKQGPATRYCLYILGKYQDNPVNKSYWVLMSRDVLEEEDDDFYVSLFKDYNTQFAEVEALAQKTGIPYMVPKVREAAISILMHHVSTGEKLYGDEPYTSMRCEEFYHEQQDLKLVIGGFSGDGLNIYHDAQEGGGYGMGVVSRFF